MRFAWRHNVSTFTDWAGLFTAGLSAGATLLAWKAAKSSADAANRANETSDAVRLQTALGDLAVTASSVGTECLFAQRRVTDAKGEINTAAALVGAHGGSSHAKQLEALATHSSTLEACDHAAQDVLKFIDSDDPKPIERVTKDLIGQRRCQVVVAAIRRDLEEKIERARKAADRARAVGAVAAKNQRPDA
jgi:hypothetical protein